MRSSIHRVHRVLSLGVAGYALDDPDEQNESATEPIASLSRSRKPLKKLARRVNRHPITIEAFVVLNVVSYISAFTELSLGLGEERTFWAWLALDLLFISAIVCERLLHLAVFWHSQHRYLLWSSHWLYFDLVLVGTSPMRFLAGDEWTRWWTALRACRVLYVFRATRNFKQFQALIETLWRAVQRSAAPLALIFFFTTFYAMFGVAFFSQIDVAYTTQTGASGLSHEYSGRYWATASRAMLTLFQVWTMDNLSEILRPLVLGCTESVDECSSSGGESLNPTPAKKVRAPKHTCTRTHTHTSLHTTPVIASSLTRVPLGRLATVVCGVLHRELHLPAERLPLQPAHLDLRDRDGQR